MMDDEDFFKQPEDAAQSVLVVASLLWLGVAVMAACMSLAVWWRWIA